MNCIFHLIVTAKQPTHLNVSHSNFALNEQRLGNKFFYCCNLSPFECVNKKLIFVV